MKYAIWRGIAAPLTAIACALVLQACGGGGGGDNPPKATTSGQQDTPTPEPTPPANPSALAPGVPFTYNSDLAIALSVRDSTAQVTLPAQAFVYADRPAQVVQGQVDLAITPISPSVNPMGMAGGSYVARVPGNDGQTQLIESFGAITVDLTQGGERLQLAPGKTATIRIPLDTRSTERPKEIPLYYWNETDKVWIQEGMATLKTDAATGKSYYEGQVSHFSTWNADKPIDQSVEIQGCVDSSVGVPAAAERYRISTEGQDYSGLAWGNNTGGSFKVLAKKGGRVSLVVTYDGKRQTRDLGVVNGPLTSNECFVLDATSGVTGTPEAFMRLVSTMVQALGMSVSPGVLIDTSTLSPRAPADVCQTGTGTVSHMNLDGSTIHGGEPLSPTDKHTITASFAACAPQNDSLQFGATTKGPLTGDTSTRFSYTFNTATQSFDLSMHSTLAQLQDGESKLSNTGVYDLSLQQGASGTTATITVNAGAEVTNLESGNTAVFQGGSMTSSTDSTTEVATLSFKDLRYTLNGATYVLNGSATPTATQYTLSKNGGPPVTLKFDGVTYRVTGVIDPF